MISFPSQQKTTDKVLHLAIVGHTNTGKTSLLRTLAHRVNFGQVQDAAGTTKQVEKWQSHQKALSIQWFDTPGLEDSMALLDYLDQLKQQAGTRLDGPDQIARFLESSESHLRYEQEARVLKALLNDCDAGLYVVDVREPIRAKYKDELTLLDLCGKPIIPVLNFLTAPQNHKEQWVTTFKRLGLHVYIEFDTVAIELNSEPKLYQTLALVLDTFSLELNQLSEQVVQAQKERHQQATQLLAETLIDVVAYKQQSQPEEEAVAQAWHAMQEKIRERENRFNHKLLALYQFRQSDYINDELPIQNERWGMDLFHPDALADMGIHLAKGFVAGAALGATIDVFTGGLSLGAATVTGGILGSLWQGADKWGSRLKGRLQGYRELSVEDSVLRLIAVRGLTLIDALEKRGHAAMDHITRSAEQNDLLKRWQKEDLPSKLEVARTEPTWSTLDPDYESSSAREEAVKQVSVALNV